MDSRPPFRYYTDAFRYEDDDEDVTPIGAHHVDDIAASILFPLLQRSYHQGIHVRNHTPDLMMDGGRLSTGLHDQDRAEILDASYECSGCGRLPHERCRCQN